jgi:hypothetical protein
MIVQLLVLVGVFLVTVVGLIFALRNPAEYSEVSRHFECPVKHQSVDASFTWDTISEKDRAVVSCSALRPKEKCGQQCLGVGHG